jgi:hypothetical protein
MSKLLLAISIALGISTLVGCFQADTEDKPTPVLVFGIDGATWQVLKPMIEAGELPNIEQHYRSGIRGVLQTHPPVISPVSWTTILTGHLPDQHGIKDWMSSSSNHRKVKAVWNIASEAGYVSNVFNVPGTWPPERVNGVMMSGFPLSGSHVGGTTGIVSSREGLADSDFDDVYKDNLDILLASMQSLQVGEWGPWFNVQIEAHPNWFGRMRIKRLDEDRYYISPFYRSDEGMIMSYPQGMRALVSDQIGEQYIPEGPGWSKHAEPDTPRYLFEHLVDVSRMQTDAASLFAGEDWQLFIYVNTLVDRVSHPYWAYMNAQDYEGLDPAKAREYAEVVRNAYRETDRQLGELLADIEGEYYFIIASDHGFKSNPNKTQYIGTHDYNGVYLISGPGLEGEDGPPMNIEDIAPTIVYLLGMPYADDLAGDAPPLLVERIGFRPEQIASYETGGRQGSDIPVDEATWKQLQGLGYVGNDPSKND